MGLVKPIALDPGTGGACIAPAALAAGDIIVSTTSASVSVAIRIGDGAVVSHARVYVGDGKVIEAVAAGVVEQALDTAIADDTLTVAYRHPDMTSAAARKAIDWLKAQKGSAYTVAGALTAASPIGCRVIGPRSAAFFCSQLVAEAYHQAGLPLGRAPSQCITPGMIVDIAHQRLIYVGHLKGNPSWFPVFSS